MLRTVCRNITLKLPKNIVNALDNSKKINPKKYEMSESHTSPFLVYTKGNNKFVSPIEKTFKYADEKRLHKKK